MTVFENIGVAHLTAHSLGCHREMIHVDGLSDRFAESPRFVRVVRLSRVAESPLGYIPPTTIRSTATCSASREARRSQATSCASRRTLSAHDCATGGIKYATFLLREIWPSCKKPGRTVTPRARAPFSNRGREIKVWLKWLPRLA